jgi:hypothetical protein
MLRHQSRGVVLRRGRRRHRAGVLVRRTAVARRRRVGAFDIAGVAGVLTASSSLTRDDHVASSARW